jgi:hypothetical protein
MAGGMAQVVECLLGLEFKPQYQEKKQNKETMLRLTSRIFRLKSKLQLITDL